MKHKTIKKSIIIIMICTLLFSCISSFAFDVVIENFEIIGRDSVELTPEMVINSQPDQATGNYYITYMFSYNIDFFWGSNARNTYFTGMYNYNVAVNLPNAYTVKAITFETYPIYDEFISMWGRQRGG